MARLSAQRIADRVIALLAVIALLSFAGGLYDVALQSLEREGPFAPAPPADVGRDATLSVAVRDEAGTPLPGASVSVYWERDGTYYLAGRGQTGADGRLTLGELPRGAVWVLVEAPGRARLSTQLVLGETPRSAEVALPAAVELRVRVVDDERQPIARATVVVTGTDPLPFGALTGTNGAAHLTRLGPPPWSVKVSAPGYESVTRSGVTGDLIVILRPLGALEVIVQMPDGSPAPGASVVLAGSNLWPARRATTDSEGRVTVAGLLSGAYDLRAMRGSLVSDTLYGVALERGQNEAIILRLIPGRMVTVVVTEGEGDSPPVVHDADVVLVEGGLSSFPIRGRTGADGTVTLGPIPTGPATLAARAEGFVARGAVPVPPELDEPVRIPLLRGATLKGVVEDARGYPVDGASIEVIGTDVFGMPVSETPMLMAFRQAHFEWALPGPVPLIPAGELGVMPGPVPPIPRAFGSPLAPAGPTAADFDPSDLDYEPWVTDHIGEFTAAPVTPGRVRALVRHPEYVEAVSEAVTIGPGGEAQVKVVLYPGGALEGRVVDYHGLPVAGARVDLTAVKGTLERTVFTSSDGSFAFAALPEEVVVSVARPDEINRVVVRETLSVAPEDRTDVEIELPEERAQVTLVVRDEVGVPVDAAQITLTSLDEKVPLRRTLFSDADGVAVLGDAEGLPLLVVVEAPGWARLERRVAEAPEQLELELKHGVLVTGTVTAVRGRSYVENASVTLVTEGRRLAALSDAEGHFTIRDVSPGPARLQVSHFDYAPVEKNVEVEPTGRADRPFELDDIELEPGGTLEGRVLDAEGKPVLGARVAKGVAPAYLPVGSLPPGMAVSDSEGKFRLSGLATGTVELEAYAPGRGRGKVSAEVTAERPTRDVEIRLVAGRDEPEPLASGGVAVTLAPGGAGRVRVTQVAEASEAERVGLLAGDVIVAVNGAAPASLADARMRLAGPVGSDVLLELLRDGGTKRLRVVREPVRR